MHVNEIPFCALDGPIDFKNQKPVSKEGLRQSSPLRNPMTTNDVQLQYTDVAKNEQFTPYFLLTLVLSPSIRKKYGANSPFLDKPEYSNMCIREHDFIENFYCSSCEPMILFILT